MGSETVSDGETEAMSAAPGESGANEESEDSAEETAEELGGGDKPTGDGRVAESGLDGDRAAPNTQR